MAIAGLEPPKRAQVAPLTLAPKQIEGMKLCEKKKYVLFSGCRISGKTRASLAALCHHAWNTWNADICVLTISQSVGLDSGVWDQLVRNTMPRYMAWNTEMQWIRESHIRSATKKPACSVTNKYGGESRLSLESLNDETEVEERFKSREYTCIYVPELSNFTERTTFDILSECLRGDIPEDQFLFVSDTNPSDAGESSWIWQLFFKRRTQSYSDYCAEQTEQELPCDSEEQYLSFQKLLGLLEFDMFDNPFLSEQRKNEIIGKYSHSVDLHARYVMGRWVVANSGALFAQQFRPAFHIRGELKTNGNPDPPMIVPRDETWTLCDSWDPGNSRNSAVSFFEKTMWVVKGGRILLPHFSVFDELAIVGKQHTIPELVDLVLEKRRWWEEYCGRKFTWLSFSDRSVWAMREPMRNRLYVDLIREASDGEIEIQAPEDGDRGPGTVKQRVDLLRRLLFEERIFFSNPKCPNTITMLKALPADENRPDEPPKAHKLKHIFDALTYGVAGECYDEMRNANMRSALRGRDGSSGIVSVSA